MSASQLATNWICIATAGETVDKRAIEEQWLLDAAELYDPSLYTALLWPEHSRNFGNMGEVLELKAERDDEGILRLYARLCPGISLLQANANGQLLFLSPEFTPDGNFRNTGKTYLEGLAVTDSPAGVSTTRLRFSRTKGKRIGPYKPLAFDEVREFKKEKGMSKAKKAGAIFSVLKNQKRPRSRKHHSLMLYRRSLKRWMRLISVYLPLKPVWVRRKKRYLMSRKMWTPLRKWWIPKILRAW